VKKKIIPLLLALYFSSSVLAIFYYFTGPDNRVLEQIRYFQNAVLYSCLILCFLFETDNLADFHLDRATLAITIFFGIIRISRRDIPNEFFYKSVVALLALGLLFLAIKNWRKIPPTNSKYWAQGLLACLWIIPISIIEIANFPMYANSLASGTVSVWILAIRAFLQQLSFTTPSEEIMFRGFLWGYLLRYGYSENKSFWLQALHFGQSISGELSHQ
jgi:hypothetical protein